MSKSQSLKALQTRHSELKCFFHWGEDQNLPWEVVQKAVRRSARLKKVLGE